MSDTAQPSQVLAAPVFCGGGSLGALAGTGMVAAAQLVLRRKLRRLVAGGLASGDGAQAEPAAGTVPDV